MPRRQPQNNGETSPHWLAAAGLALAVAGSALLFSRSFVSVFGFTKLLTLGTGVWLAAVGAVLSKIEAERTPLDAPFLAVAAIMALSVLNSPDRSLSVLGTHGFYAYGLWPMGLVLALGWLSAQLVKGRELLLLRICLVAYGLVGLYALLQIVSLEPFAGIPALINNRALSSLGSPVFLGECMTLMLPLGIFWAGERKCDFFGVVCLAAIAGGLWASVSRGAWLSAGIGCGLYAMLRWGRGFLSSPRRLALVGLATLLLGAIFFWKLNRRDIPTGDGGRVAIWRTAWNIFRERPILGWGVNTFRITSRPRKTPEMVQLLAELPAPRPRTDASGPASGASVSTAGTGGPAASTVIATAQSSHGRWEHRGALQVLGHAHNDFLQTLATTGLMGFAAYCWVLVCLVQAALRSSRDSGRPWATAVSCGLVGFFVNMKFNPAPLEALACASFFAGLLSDPVRSPQEGGKTSRRWPFYVFLFAATLSQLLVFRLAWAEMAQKSGNRSLMSGRLDQAQKYYEKASRLNPWELSYQTTFINFLSARSFGTASPLLRRSFLEEAEKIAQDAVERHPNDHDAHYYAGIARLNLVGIGEVDRLDAAEISIDKALSLDPTFIPSLQLRRDAALARGDVRRVEEMMQRIRALGSEELPTVLRRRIN